MDSVLRPRDIQARIRSGESPEAVAAAAQTTVDRIMGFATPVLAERAYVAQQAQKASVRRRSGDGPIGALGQAVAERLATRDIDPGTVEWDAWRREDGRWTLVADFGAGRSVGRARFVYDTAGRYVVADDDESRWLVGERHGAEAAAAPAAAAAQDAPPLRRLSAVGSEQVPLGDDAIEVVTGRRPADLVIDPAITAVETAEEPTVDLTETRTLAAPAPVGAEPEALFDAPAAPVVPPRQAEPAGEAVIPAEPSDDRTAETVEPLGDSGQQVAEQQAAAPKDRKPARGRARASVPSWDEIMFGSSRGE